MKKRRRVFKFHEFPSFFCRSKKTWKIRVFWRHLASKGRPRHPQKAPRGSKKGSQIWLMVELGGAFSSFFSWFFEGSCNFFMFFLHVALRCVTTNWCNAFCWLLKTPINMRKNGLLWNSRSARPPQKAPKGSKRSPARVPKCSLRRPFAPQGAPGAPRCPQVPFRSTQNHDFEVILLQN